MNGLSSITKRLPAQGKDFIIKRYSPFLLLIIKVIMVSLLLSVIIRLISFIPLSIAYPEEVGLDAFFNFSLFSQIYDASLPIFLGSALWITLKLVLFAWSLSVILALFFLFLKSRYYKFNFLWNLVLSIGGIHVFGLFIIVQHLTSVTVSYILLVLVLAIGSGSLKEMVHSFEVVYKDVIRKEYWRFMYSQGVPPLKIGFDEFLVRFTELSFTKLPILLIGSILVEAASNTLGLGYYLLDGIKYLQEGRVDMDILTGISFTMIFLVLLSQGFAEYIRVKFDPQSKL